MKLLKWILDIQRRHYRDIRNYNKGTVASKIFAIVTVIVFALISLGLEYWGLDLLKTNAVGGLLVLLILALAFGLATIDYCNLYCFLGFVMFFSGSIQNIVMRVEKRRKKKQNDTEENNQSEEEIKRAHNFLDLLVAIVSLSVGVGLLILSLLMLSKLSN